MRRPPRVPGIKSSRVLYLLPSIPDDLEPEIKNALAIRNTASTTGVCPDCGAEPELYSDPEYDGVIHAVFQHEPECHALTDDGAAA